MKQKKDSSPQVPQRDKVKQSLEIKEFNWTEKQKTFIKLAQDKDTNIVFVTGPAGSAKTLLSAYASLSLLQKRRVSDIIYIRSAVESASASLGFLPGEVGDKMSFYGIPIMDKLEELLPKTQRDALIKDKRVNVMPVNFLRGQSWNARVAIVDEAQNMTQEELFTIVTRLGEFSKCFILADPSQSDIGNKSGGFLRLRNHYCTLGGAEKGIYSFELGAVDIVRSDLVRYLVEKYAELK